MTDRVVLEKSTINECRRLIEQGAEHNAVARMVGVSKIMLEYALRKERVKKRNRKSYLKHREKRLKEMREYCKRYRKLKTKSHD